MDGEEAAPEWEMMFGGAAEAEPAAAEPAAASDQDAENGVFSGLLCAFEEPLPAATSAGGDAEAEAAAGAEGEAAVPAEPRRPPDVCAGQLADLVLARQEGCSELRSQLLSYLEAEASKPPPASGRRRLVLLRGPPGVDKARYAQDELKDETGSESLAVHLAHICSPDDFFASHSDEVVAGCAELVYRWDRERRLAIEVSNESRVRLAMEVGLDPLYVASANLTTWEMRPFALLADRFGYDLVAVPPQEISLNWSDVSLLAAQLKLKFGDDAGQEAEPCFDEAELQAFVDAYEPLPYAEDPLPTLRAAKRRPRTERPAPDSAGETKGGLRPAGRELVPSALLVRLERLLRDGFEATRYTPAQGRGWGASAELDDEWVSFREQGDGSCEFEDETGVWWTVDADHGWTITEQAMLSALRKRAQDLPEADLPSAASHPGLFAEAAAQAKGGAPAAAATPAASASRQGAVPTSRAERMRMKVEQDRADPTPAANDPKTAFKRMAANALTKVKEERRPGSEPQTGASRRPAESVEISTAEFMAAAKARLIKFSKEDLYHDFVVALSGDVDAKTAVNILRGHNDLLQVFRSKFAPRLDLKAVKQELDNDGVAPRPPSSGAKEQGPKPPAAAPRPPAAGPRPPVAAPPRGVKRELVKGEVKSEAVTPMPPKLPPGLKGRTVSVGDDSEEDEAEWEDETSVLSAVKKGRDECIASLARMIFRKEREAHDGARIRLAMVRYATRRAAVPRFPRELHILRGPPGIGKTEYAMQQLVDFAGFGDDEVAAARLTHVCAADDFFERFVGASSEAVYKFDVDKVDAYHRKNVTRARLAMEAGIHPLFIDCTNTRIWEMTPYMELADKLGYVVSVVEPQDINEKFDDSAFLASATDTKERRQRGKVVSQGVIEALVQAFEPLEDLKADGSAEGRLRKVREARQPEGGSRAVKAVAVPIRRGKGSGRGRGQGGSAGPSAAPNGKRAASQAPAIQAWSGKVQRTSQGYSGYPRGMMAR